MAEANYFDPEEDATPAAPGDTSSTDNSKSGVRRAWDAWTSRPENNAALLQFGVAMMQPRAQGQTSFGQFGNALAEGAGASDRNIAQQQLEEDRIAKRGDQETTNELRRAQAGAATTNAAAYSRIADGQTGASAKTALSQNFRLQQGFRTWLQKAEDISGFSKDPILEVIKKKYPNIQSKADLADPANRQIASEAFNIYKQNFATEPSDAEASPAATPAPASPPPGPPPVPGAKWYNGQWVTRGPNGEAVPIGR